MSAAKVTKRELLRYTRRSQLGRPAYFGRDPANAKRWLVRWGFGANVLEYRAPTIRELTARIYARAYKHLQSPAQQLADRDVKRLVGRARHAANVHQPALLRRLEVPRGF